MNTGISKRYIGLSVIAALAGLSWWLQQEEQGAHLISQGEQHVIDYSLKDFEITAMDERGLPRHIMKAAHMVHYSDDDSAELSQPHMLVYREKGGPWILQSEAALVYQGGDKIWLQGDVHIEQRREDDKGMLLLDTRDLWIYADQDYAESSEAVVIRDGLSVTRAKGLKIDLEQGRMQLLANVRGEYVANSE